LPRCGPQLRRRLAQLTSLAECGGARLSRWALPSDSLARCRRLIDRLRPPLSLPPLSLPLRPPLPAGRLPGSDAWAAQVERRDDTRVCQLSSARLADPPPSAGPSEFRLRGERGKQGTTMDSPDNRRPAHSAQLAKTRQPCMANNRFAWRRPQFRADWSRVALGLCLRLQCRRKRPGSRCQEISIKVARAKGAAKVARLFHQRFAALNGEREF